MSILGKYEADLAKMVAKWQELSNAEKLLDLHVTVYPEVINVQKDMKNLRVIYDLYTSQKVWFVFIYCKMLLQFPFSEHLSNICISFVSLNHPGCKDQMVWDPVGGFKHPAAARRSWGLHQKLQAVAQRCPGDVSGIFPGGTHERVQGHSASPAGPEEWGPERTVSL